MGEYERMVFDFLVIVAVPVLMAVATVVLAARVLLRATRAAIAPVPVLAMVTAWATTTSTRVVGIATRARAPSSWELLRV